MLPLQTLGAECSPSRASWLTGRSPSDARVRINLVLASRAQNKVRGNVDFLNTSTPTVTSVLKQSPHGYRTGHFGKWHLVRAAAVPRSRSPACKRLTAPLHRDAVNRACFPPGTASRPRRR